MTGRKGFTLIELVITLIIVATLAAIAVPNYINYVQQGAAQAAQNNLMTIFGAQKNYYFNNGGYCTNSCDNLADINTNLSLNLTDSYYVYTCACSFSGSCGTPGVAYCYAQLATYPHTFYYETAGTPIYGINTLSNNSGTLSCGALAASNGLHGAGCNSTPNDCPGMTYEGQTFDCVSCCAN